MNERIRIIRPVVDEEVEQLEVVNDLKKAFPRRGIYDRDIKGQTLVTKYEFKTFRPMNSSFKYAQALHRILYPIPESGKQEQTFNVLDIRYYSSSIGHRSLALTLDDPEDILQQERETYLRRMNKTEKYLTPHVTIANIDASHATSDIVKWVEEIAPASLTLGPITYDPHVDPIVRSRPPSTSLKARSILLPIAPMRIVDQMRVPDVLFNSFRPKTDSETKSHE